MRQWARQPAGQRYESTHLFWTICPARGGGVGLAMTITVKQGERVILVPEPKTVVRAISTTREWVGQATVRVGLTHYRAGLGITDPSPIG